MSIIRKIINKFKTRQNDEHPKIVNILKLDPNDIIVLQHSHILNTTQIEKFKHYIQELGIKNKIIILDINSKLSIIKNFKHEEIKPINIRDYDSL